MDKLCVLVVEDNPMNQRLMCALLSKGGIQVDVAENGAIGLERLRATPQAWHLVLMDIQMPVMDGIEATRQIRADPRFAELPIIAVTANAMAENRQQCLQVGMQDFLTKPINRNTLFEAIERWARKT